MTIRRQQLQGLPFSQPLPIESNVYIRLLTRKVDNFFLPLEIISAHFRQIHISLEITV